MPQTNNRSNGVERIQETTLLHSPQNTKRKSTEPPRLHSVDVPNVVTVGWCFQKDCYFEGEQ